VIVAVSGEEKAVEFHTHTSVPQFLTTCTTRSKPKTKEDGIYDNLTRIRSEDIYGWVLGTNYKLEGEEAFDAPT